MEGLYVSLRVWIRLFFPKLRKYTDEFGDKIAEECGRLIRACPKPGDPDESADPLEMWVSWDLGSMWDEAALRDVIKYLYGAKSLRIPATWKQLMPEFV